MFGKAMTVALSLGLAFVGLTTRSAAQEYGVDRPGQDYTSFDLSGNNPAACHQACRSDAQCRAWTYVRAGVQGPNSRCWLKNGVPGAVRNDCCISGVMEAAASLSSPKLVCAREVDKGAAFAELRIRNFGPAPVAPRTSIDFRLSTGETGSVVSDGIAPGSSELHQTNKRASDPAFTCTATARP
jgi:PAN domain